MAPRIGAVLLQHRPELQADGLGQTVVDVVERALINVHLALPVLTRAVERDLAVQTHPGLIDGSQLFPFLVALGRGQLGMLVDDVLEVIHHCAVGDEGQRTRQMAVAEFAGIRAEEAIGPRPGEELHRHRVDLAGLHAGPDVGVRDSVTVHVGGKGVAGLVGHDLDVVLGAVEVGKNKRHFVIAQARAVATARLAGGGQHVHELVVQHFVEEHAGLGGKLLIELFALLEDGVGVARRAGVAAAEHQGIVGCVHRVLLAQPPGLLAVDAVGQRHDVLDDGGAELFHIGLRVAVAPHAVVAQRGVALIAELFAHGVTQVDELVVEAVKLGPVLFVPCALGLPGGQTAGIVGVVLEGGQLAQRVDAALKRDLRRRDQLAVLGGQLVFLCHLVEDVGRERLVRNLGVDEHQVAVLGGEVSAKRRIEHRAVPGVLALLQLGSGLVPEVHLLIVEFVAGVNRIAHAGQLGKRVHMLVELFLLQKNGVGLGVGGSRLEAGQQVSKLLLDGVQVGACIGHFRKFHSVAPLRTVLSVL